jgi:hypothetical protein
MGQKACGSVRRAVLYTIFIEFSVSMTLVGLLKMCLNEAHSNVRIQTGLKQSDALSQSIFSFDSVYTNRKVKENQEVWN